MASILRPGVLNRKNLLRGSYAFFKYILGVIIFSLKGRLFISRRSLSPVIRMSAPASRQHSRTKLSSGSRQIDNLFLGETTRALDTKAAIPAINALNCSLSIFFFAKRSRGTLRYSFRSDGETQIWASSNAFTIDFLGRPPKANAEMITEVSMMTLSFLSVRLPPNGFHGVLNIING